MPPGPGGCGPGPGPAAPGNTRMSDDLPIPRNVYRAMGDDIIVDAEVIPPAERRDTVRRLVALCHTVNDLVAAAEAAPFGGGESAALFLEHAHHIQAVLRDTVVDLVANGHAHRTDAA